MNRPSQELSPHLKVHNYQPDQHSSASLIGVVALNANTEPTTGIHIHVQSYPRLRKFGIPNNFIEPGESHDSATSRILRPHLLSNKEDAYKPEFTDKLGMFPHWENTIIHGRMHRLSANMPTDLISMTPKVIEDSKDKFIPSHYAIISTALAYAAQNIHQDPLWILPSVALEDHMFDINQLARVNNSLSGRSVDTERNRILSDANFVKVGLIPVRRKLISYGQRLPLVDLN